VHENRVVFAFWSDVLSGTVADLIGGALVALLAYALIERRLRLREDRARRAELTRAILAAVEDELHRNAGVADALIEHLPNGSLPYSRFGTESWPLVAQIPALTALDGRTVKALLATYILTREANEQHSLLLDLTYGATGAVAFLVASTSTESGASSFRRFDERRDDLRARLLRRVEDLRPHLQETARLVADQLERSHPGEQDVVHA
jgi:hypothetical protein